MESVPYQPVVNALASCDPILHNDGSMVFYTCNFHTNVQTGRVLSTSHSGMSVYYVMLLCGDITLNPGPIQWPCTVYGKCVHSNQRAFIV